MAQRPLGSCSRTTVAFTALREPSASVQDLSVQISGATWRLSVSRQRSFTQEDPIGVAGGLNLYGYAGGDPVNNSDPFGLCPPCDGWGFMREAVMSEIVRPLQKSVGISHTVNVTAGPVQSSFAREGMSVAMSPNIGLSVTTSMSVGSRGIGGPGTLSFGGTVGEGVLLGGSFDYNPSTGAKGVTVTAGVGFNLFPATKSPTPAKLAGAASVVVVEERKAQRMRDPKE